MRPETKFPSDAALQPDAVLLRGTDGIVMKLSEPTNVRLATIAGARG
jgi:hypothetical protein